MPTHLVHMPANFLKAMDSFIICSGSHRHDPSDRWSPNNAAAHVYGIVGMGDKTPLEVSCTHEDCRDTRDCCALLFSSSLCPRATVSITTTTYRFRRLLFAADCRHLSEVCKSLGPCTFPEPRRPNRAAKEQMKPPEAVARLDPHRAQAG